MKRFVAFMVGVLLAGCGHEVPPGGLLQQEFVTVINLQGEREAIPAGELIDPDTGQPSVKAVLAIDRRRGKNKWVSVDEVMDGPPAMARYLPMTHQGRAAAEQAVGPPDPFTEKSP